MTVSTEDSLKGTLRPFEGIRIVDATHVLAGPFAAYQMALLGADVIKVEDPNDPDQSRDGGADLALNEQGMGMQFMGQACNKRSLALDLKTEDGRAVFKRLVATADILVENYRPGAFEALGLGYEAMREIKPRLIYCSMSAFGQHGPRRTQTAYDSVVQAACGIMSMNGTPQTGPFRIAAPTLDYATGTMAAFALASALFQRQRTGLGQHIDLAMLDVGLMLEGVVISDYLRTGKAPRQMGNQTAHATNATYGTATGLMIIGATNLRQQKRLWNALGRPEMAKTTNKERLDDHARETALLSEILLTRPAEEWEVYLQSHRVPASRIRTVPEALADPQLKARGVIQEFEGVLGMSGKFGVTAAAFSFAHGGPRIDSAPPRVGQHTDALLRELGYSSAETARLRSARAV